MAIPLGLAHKIDRFTALAMLAAGEACDYLETLSEERIGVYIGNVYAGWSYGEEQLKLLVETGPESVHPFQATAWFPAAAQGELTIRHGWRGPAKTFSGSRCAFAEALFAASMSLSCGRIDVAVVGFAESTVSPFVASGANLALENAKCAEDAFFVLIGSPMLAFPEVEVSLEANSEAAVEVHPPAWGKYLRDSFRALLDRSVETIKLPLSNQTSEIRIRRPSS